MYTFGVYVVAPKFVDKIHINHLKGNKYIIYIGSGLSYTRYNSMTMLQHAMTFNWINFLSNARTIGFNVFPIRIMFTKYQVGQKLTTM